MYYLDKWFLKSALSILPHFIATLDNNRLQIEITTISLISSPEFNKGVKDAEGTNSTKLIKHLPHNHRLTIIVVTLKRSLATSKPFVCSVATICCAQKPSLPHNVPFRTN